MIEINIIIILQFTYLIIYFNLIPSSFLEYNPFAKILAPLVLLVAHNCGNADGSVKVAVNLE
mgnify:FL=1